MRGWPARVSAECFKALKWDTWHMQGQLGAFVELSWLQSILGQTFYWDMLDRIELLEF